MPPLEVEVGVRGRFFPVSGGKPAAAAASSPARFRYRSHLSGTERVQYATDGGKPEAEKGRERQRKLV